MTEFYAFLLAFAKEHWFLFWCALWLPIFLLYIIGALLGSSLKAVTVWVRGYPPVAPSHPSKEQP